MAVVLPYIDTALRQVTHLPHQNNEHLRGAKGGPEIAGILEISSFTVKNHMQRVFKKLDVTNRAQAVSKLMPLANNAQN